MSVTHRRSAHTLIEVVVAALVASVVLGAGTALYVNGAKGFNTATDHAWMREQVIVPMLRISRDLGTLMVSNQKHPRTGRFHMVDPYELLNVKDREQVDPKTGSRRVRRSGSGIRFFVYQRTDMVRVREKDGEREVEVETAFSEFPPLTPCARYPRVVGRVIEYTTRVALDGGVDLLRNGVKVNPEPLAEVRFEKGDPIHARLTLGASPSAVIEVTLVPMNGLSGKLDSRVVEAYDRANGPMTETFHLVEYESQYTMVLGLAVHKRKIQQELDKLEEAVIADAEVYGFLGEAEEKFHEAPIGYRLPDDLVVLEDEPLDEEERLDREFGQAKSVAAVLPPAPAGSARSPVIPLPAGFRPAGSSSAWTPGGGS